MVENSVIIQSEEDEDFILMKRVVQDLGSKLSKVSISDESKKGSKENSDKKNEENSP